MSDPYEADLGEDLDDELEPDEDLEPDDTEPDDLDGLDEPGEGDETDDEQPAPQARQPSRGENRVAAATRAAAEAKAEAALLRRQMAELAQRQNQPQQPTQEQINAHLATLEPWERTEFLRQQDNANTQATLRQMQFAQQEQMDKIAYEALKVRAPIAGKLEKDVEQRLAEMRAAGTTAPRETVLRWVIGDRALANAGRATGRAQRSATANRERQTARPANNRADSAPSNQRGSNTASARDKRLENLNI